MAQFERTCSECGASLSGRATQTKTCSDKCRGERSRRLKRQSRENGKAVQLPAHQAAVARAVRQEAPDIAHSVIQDELVPIVRESITEDVLAAIRDMVGLAPTAVAALAQDLQSDDSKVRQKAYDLWLRYTVGHSAIVRPEEDESSKQLIVNFQLPRPDGTEVVDEESEPAEAVEERKCLMCGTDKAVSQFVGNSDRCQDCHELMAKQAKELLDGG